MPEKLPIGVSEDLLVTVPRGQYDHLKANMNIPSTLIAPFKKGQKVGTLKVMLDGKPVAERPLISLEDAPAGNIFTRAVDSVMLMFKSDDKSESSE